jgi:hypothetical protein
MCNVKESFLIQVTFGCRCAAQGVGFIGELDVQGASVDI